ncbi:chitinase [Histoplasma capsulatum var. duboisii H88]|uniref:chitinase n=1 Tax=Ajellomyces capsulatus (strain H88) TaxID=544711 RepID=F0UL59_AJEC8|nr:chitinase [Histoplasma capsulatum var. duboisii H88]
MYPFQRSPSVGLGSNELPSQNSVHRSGSGIPMHWNAVYYANWRANDMPPPSSLNLGYISHIFYAFACNEWVDERQPVDGTEGYLRALVHRKRDSKVKVLLSIGGGGNGGDIVGSRNFAAVAASPAAVERFLSSAADLMNKFQLDGLDINWEHPETLEQGYDYNTLLYRLRERFPSPPYLLTTALSAGEWVLSKINLVEAHLYVDLINLMTYDFSGPWMPLSGHHAQLYAPPDPQKATLEATAATTTSATTSGSSGVAYLLSWGVPAGKILLGIPVYGRAFPGANGINQPYERGTAGGEKVFDYRELPLPGTEEVHDAVLCAAYCVDFGGCSGSSSSSSGGGGGDGPAAGFISYDSPRTVMQKAQFVSEYELGGLFYWHLAADAEVGTERSLVATGYRALHSWMMSTSNGGAGGKRRRGGG